MRIMKKTSTVFLSAIMCISSLSTSNMVYAMETEEKEEAIILENSEVGTEELVVENIPEEISEELNIDEDKVIEISARDAEDLSSITVVNNDATETAYMFSEPVKYVDENNNIKFIDNTITEIQGDDVENKYEYESTGNSFDVSYAKKLADGVLVEEGDYSFAMKPISENESQAELKDIDFKNNSIEEKVIEYADAFGVGEHIQYETVNTGIKESILVEEYDGNLEYEFEIDAKDLVPDVVSGNQIEFLDKETKECIFTIQPTFLEDSYLDENGQSHISYDNFYEVEDRGDGKYLLTMIIDQEFMEDSSTVYPVIIDPTIGVGDYDTLSSSYAFQNGETKSYVNGVLWVGNYANRGEAISYIKPTGMTKRKYINPDNINSATLYITDDSVSGYSSTCKVNLYDSNTTSSVSSVTYATLLSKIGSYQSSATLTTLYADYSFDITYLTKQWIRNAIGQGGWTQNYGFILRADLGTSAPGRRLDAESMVIVLNYSTDEICEGIYTIKNVSQNKYLRYNTSTQLSMSGDLKSSAIQWKVSRNTDGSYKICPINNSNWAINSASSSFTAGTSVITGNGTNSSWRIVKNNDGSYRMIPGSAQAVVNTALAYNSSTGYTYLQEYTNSKYQKWIFEPVITLSDFYIKSARYTNKNLSLNSSGYTCIATSSTTLDKQRWNFVKQSDGTYMIFNTSGDWSTRVAGQNYGKNYIGTESSGSNVKMTSSGSKKWKLVMNSDSTYSFVDENGKYLTLASSGTTVTAQAYSGTRNQKWTLETAKKYISVGGMSDRPTNDESIWVNNNVKSACSLIGCRDIIHFNKGSNEEVLDMIKDSSIFAILTHGNINMITCNENGPGMTPKETYITSDVLGEGFIALTELPDNCFSTTRLAVLGACMTAGDYDPNFATALHQKGVQTVIGFSESVLGTDLQEYLNALIVSLGNGNSLGVALANAEETAIDTGDYWYGIMKESRVVVGNTDLTATFKY